MNPGQRPTAWITGAAGLIGSHLLRQAPAHWHTRGLTRTDVDLTDFDALDRLFRTDPPQLVIHCAAISRSPACQADPTRARLVNTDVTRHLSELCHAIPFIFLSTDLVFDGRQGNYSETAATHPLSVYAETKVAAEAAVLPHPRHLVVRTSLNGGASPTRDRGFNEELRQTWSTGKTLRLFTDEFRCPIPAEVTARALWELVTLNATGLYHVAGSERLSRWDIGQLIAARHPELHPQLEPASLKEYSGTPRSPDTSLNCTKAQALLSFPLPSLRSWLADHPNAPF